MIERGIHGISIDTFIEPYKYLDVDDILFGERNVKFYATVQKLFSKFDAEQREHVKNVRATHGFYRKKENDKNS